uniref:Ankyrin repeat domain-containing protein SOWAHA-like n=1 Tax=Sinocyclocheilus rhinocerous TaxID=307959 RepID=A0A673GJ19_9TELE
LGDATRHKGKVKNSELLSKFKDLLNCSDPAEKKQNRDLFKTFVNNIAVVKDFQDAKYIVLKKVYHHLLEKSEQKPDPDFSGAAKKEASTNKPYALPLRMPQIDLGHHHKKPSTESLGQELQPSPRCTDSVACAGASPQLQRHFKTPTQADEPKDSHHCPLDPVEHEWLVKSAAGQWNQVYGLLLKDAQLAEKKDFMSGFTALHWAVKCGDADMVCTIIEVSRKSDHGVDVNGKSNGGYTPLHIAAIHLQLFLIDLLVRKYGANGNIRDNCGKKPYHYLDTGVSRELRELLGDPKAGHREVHHQVRDEYDARKYSIGHLFLAHPVGLKKKNKARNQFISVSDDGRERDEPVLHKLRLVSDVFP